MRPGTRSVCLVLTVSFAVLVGGCGGGGGLSLAQAQSRMVSSCVDGKPRDRALCRCIVSELRSRHGYSSAASFERGRKAVESGHQPPEILASSVACARKGGPAVRPG